MLNLFRCLRRLRIRWQLRSLDVQARHIMQARNAAMTRLMEIQRDREIKERELMRQNAIEMRRLGFR